MVTYLAVTIFFLFLSFWGGQSSSFLNALEPLRFIIAMKCFLIIPAAVSLTRAAAIGRNRFLALLILLIILATVVVSIPLTDRLSAKLPEEAEQLIGFLRARTDSTGRILVQGSNARHPGKWFGSHVLFFSLYMPIEQIGGPPGRDPLKHHFAEFQEDKLFDRPLSRLTTEEMSGYLDLYNIKWIVVWTEEANAYFQGLPELVEPIAQVEAGEEIFSVFQTHQAATYFFRGSGSIRADFDRIEIDHPSPGEIIIKYHWLETLKTNPEVEMAPVMMLDDPAPFIRLFNPGYESILIYN